MSLFQPQFSCLLRIDNYTLLEIFEMLCFEGSPVVLAAVGEEFGT